MQPRHVVKALVLQVGQVSEGAAGEDSTIPGRAGHLWLLSYFYKFSLCLEPAADAKYTQDSLAQKSVNSS